MTAPVYDLPSLGNMSTRETPAGSAAYLEHNAPASDQPVTHRSVNFEPSFLEASPLQEVSAARSKGQEHSALDTSAGQPLTTSYRTPKTASDSQEEFIPSKGPAASEALDTSTGQPLRASYRTPKTALDPPNVQTAPGYKEKSGSVLVNGWVLGKKLGQGLQGAVYLLEDKDGKDAGRVYKHVAVRAIACASGALLGIEREWAIGRELNLLNEDDGYLEGFMQTGSKVLKPDGSFLGIILERLNGKDVRERLEDTCFNDIDYILAMLTQVLQALERARLAIGFEHRDTNIHNVMEHWIDEERSQPIDDTPPESQKEELGKKLDLRGLHFKIIDFGHSLTNKREAVDNEKLEKAKRIKEPKVPVYHPEKLYRAIFAGRSDTWRFMLSLGRALEGRVWEEKDEPKVRLLMEVIRHVTGYSHRMYFRSARGQHKQSLVKRPMSVGGPLYGLKWLKIMARSYYCPSHPELTPREALDFLEEQRVRMGVSEKATS